jgi:hypothetical protein
LSTRRSRDLYKSSDSSRTTMSGPGTSSRIWAANSRLWSRRTGVDELDVHADDPRVVAQQLSDLGAHRFLQGVGQVHVDTGHDDGSIAHWGCVIRADERTCVHGPHRLRRRFPQGFCLCDHHRSFSRASDANPLAASESLAPPRPSSTFPAPYRKASRNSLKFSHLTCDLSQPHEIEKVVGELRKLMPREGRILLVNNSGFGAYGEFQPRTWRTRYGWSTSSCGPWCI